MSQNAPFPAASHAAADAAERQAGASWMILRITFAVVPVVAGLDKFTNLLTNWTQYLNPLLAQALPLSPHTFMGVVGVIEIAAGVLVYFRPRLGGYVVSAWLACIALSLIASGSFLDVAVRDAVMAVSAFTLAKLSPPLD
jgi:uncharacterized membrane protein YphA (DoxX/SURF4 family)